MHRTYNSILPTPSKLLQQRWDQTYYNEHRRKVRDVVPMVDTRAPATYMHLHLKLKKLQLEEERLATIERDNRILLEKMSYIMRTRGRIDNRNNYEYRSLNREKRQRELLRVTEENQAVLRRIMNRGAEYSAEQLQRDWEENQRFMDSISRFPKDWWKREDTRINKSRRSSAQSRKQRRNRDNASTKSDHDEEQKDDKITDETKDTKPTKSKKDTKKETKKDDGKKGVDEEEKKETPEEKEGAKEEENVKGVKG